MGIKKVIERAQFLDSAQHTHTHTETTTDELGIPETHRTWGISDRNAIPAKVQQFSVLMYKLQFTFLFFFLLLFMVSIINGFITHRELHRQPDLYDTQIYLST